MNRWTRLGRSRECPEGIARYMMQDGIFYIWCAGSHGKEWCWNMDTETGPFVDKETVISVNRRDYYQAMKVLDAVFPVLVKSGAKHVQTAGISRGGAVAVMLTLILINGIDVGYEVLPPVLWAPKRLGRIGRVFQAMKHKGDIVPYLPPWYTKYGLVVMGKLELPWVAHKQALKDAAHWRSTVGRRVVWKM